VIMVGERRWLSVARRVQVLLVLLVPLVLLALVVVVGVAVLLLQTCRFAGAAVHYLIKY
jgi:hypothetical protein